MSEQEKIQELQFLLDLAISKLIDMTGIKNYPDFILRYRLTESKALALTDKIVAIEEEVKQGKTITSIEILHRLAEFSPSPIIAPVPEVSFFPEVLELLSPEILLPIYKT